MSKVLNSTITALPESSSNNTTENSTPVKTLNSKSENRIVLDILTEHNHRQFKKINQSVFPVQYNDNFYKDCLNSSIHFTKLAYFNDLVVGGVCFRLEPSDSPDIGAYKSKLSHEEILSLPKKRIYIMTLGCLTPYRRYGVGTILLNWVIQQAKELADVTGIFLHVQINNQPAKQFYESKNFKILGKVIENYYKRVEPADAYLFCYELEVSDTKLDQNQNSPDTTGPLNGQVQTMNESKNIYENDKQIKIKNEGSLETREIDVNTDNVNSNSAGASNTNKSNSKKGNKGKNKKKNRTRR